MGGLGLSLFGIKRHGTPVVGYDVAGLRDSILDGDTGILVKGNSPEASSLVSLLKNRELLITLTSNAYSKQF
jgi:glycosyltransferase involved in cell wall biosynthesis